MIVSSAFLAALFPSGAAAQDTTLLKDDRSPGKRKEGPCLPGSRRHGRGLRFESARAYIFFSELASTTFLGQAPIGSIKEVVRDCRGHFLIVLREDTGPPDAPLTGKVRRTYESAVQDQKIFGPIRRTWRLRRAANRVCARGTFSEVSSRESSRLWPQTDEKDAPAS
jgi:hypothetical protein